MLCDRDPSRANGLKKALARFPLCDADSDPFASELPVGILYRAAGWTFLIT
jgi:hypothetical protein